MAKKLSTNGAEPLEYHVQALRPNLLNICFVTMKYILSGPCWAKLCDRPGRFDRFVPLGTGEALQKHERAENG
jgi:hypothetical protein